MDSDVGNFRPDVKDICKRNLSKNAIKYNNVC